MDNMLDTDCKSPLLVGNSQTVEVVPSGVKDDTDTLVQNQVKRPMNAFFAWSRGQRKKMVSEGPKMPNGERSKKLGAQWKLLSDVEKRPFIDEAKRLRAEHLTEYPDHKFKTKRKAKTLQMDQYSPPGNLMAPGVNLVASTIVDKPRTDPYTHMIGWCNGAYTLINDQLGYIQHPGMHSALMQQMPSYDLNGLHYSHLMPYTPAYMNAASAYNISPAYTQQTSTVMSLGAMASQAENHFSSPSIAPHDQRVGYGGM